MKFTIPLYIETRNDGPEGTTRHHVSPLFFSHPVRADEDLGRAQQRLVGDLHQHLLKLGRSLRHDELAAWTFAPVLEQHRLDLQIDLRRRTARGRFFFAVFESLGRKLAFCPKREAPWFELRRQQTLAHRATAVLSEHFRKQEAAADDESVVRPEDRALKGTAWLTTVELDVDIFQVHRRPDEILRALLGGADVTDGADELRNCGRCLNWLAPLGLDRAFRRQAEVAELDRRLQSRDYRPVLLVGRRQSGKSAIVHEYVCQATARRSTPYSARRNVWLLSPQRLISGMSYVGQWESRLLAILKEARKRHHILYFDDLPGLLQAGHSRESSLSMAQVIRPFLERREVRVLAEITPDAWRVLRERDRALADLFDILPIAETVPEETARIVLAARRSLEQEFRCEFSIDALPAVLEIERRYAPQSAFPGKAVRFLKDLALLHRGRTVSRDQVLDEFHRRSGLQSRFLDPRQSLLRSDIVTALAAEVVGQPEPVATVADVLSVAKARINDTGRPMGSLLFVGPTGVGKTQLARSVAQFLFGDPNRLVRFDLNEFIARGSAARLVGTFGNPEGLLTGAVRRQPFAVILLDEIEKAHPEVFDILLQVLGEGRLSDGNGVTVSFTNTLIIMTSNLGTRDNLQRLGFGADVPPEEHVWQVAVEKFFRPEFFNRIDRIVPFRRLTRDVVAQVARVLLGGILKRDGLTRRRVLLTIAPAALDRVIEQGFSPTLGARSLKRSLEHLLIQPAARQLAALPPGVMTQLDVFPTSDGMSVHVRELRDASPRPDCVAAAPTPRGPVLATAVRDFTRRIESGLDAFRPTGPLTAGQVSHRDRAYYLIQERCRRLRSRAEALLEASEEAARTANRGAVPGGAFRPARSAPPRRYNARSSLVIRGYDDAETRNFHQTLRELFDDADLIPDADAAARAILDEAALTDLEFATLSAGIANASGVWVLPLDGLSHDAAIAVAGRIQSGLTAASRTSDIDLAIDVTRLPDPAQGVLLELSGLAAAAVLASEAGLHLEWTAPGEVHAVEVIPIQGAADRSLAEAWRILFAERQDLERQRNGQTDPLAPGPVVRISESWGLTLNLRTGDMTEGLPDPPSWQRFLMGSLTLPPEFRLTESVSRLKENE